MHRQARVQNRPLFTENAAVLLLLIRGRERPDAEAPLPVVHRALPDHLVLPGHLVLPDHLVRPDLPSHLAVPVALVRPDLHLAVPAALARIPALPGIRHPEAAAHHPGIVPGGAGDKLLTMLSAMYSGI
jgi:hypothetical protein